MKNCNGPSTIPDSQERVILPSFLRIGDRVTMAVPSTDEGWATRKVTNGTKGTVVGFKRYTMYRARIGIYQDQPGKYECNGVPVVKWDNGIFDSPSCHDIVFDDATTKDARRSDKVYNDAFDVRERVGDLPSLPFWEQDIVRNTGKPFFDLPGENLIVESINYNHYGKFCDDGRTHMPMFNVTLRSGNSGYVAVRANKLELVERGNVWWFKHDKSKMKFATLEEEIQLYRLLGLTTQVKCPATENYHWPLDQVLVGAKAGVIDLLVANMGAGKSVCAYKIQDEDLARRANAKLQEGFK